jgi:hypothetical protein
MASPIPVVFISEFCTALDPDAGLTKLMMSH